MRANVKERESELTQDLVSRLKENQLRYGSKYVGLIEGLRFQTAQNDSEQEEISALIKQEEGDVQKHLEEVKGWGSDRGKKQINLYIIENLNSMANYDKHWKLPVVKEFALSFLEINLDRIEQGVHEKHVLGRPEPPDIEPESSALCLEAISILVNYGSPATQEKAYDILSRNIGEFVEDLSNWHNNFPCERILETIIHHSHPPQNETQQRVAAIREFISLLPPLNDLEIEDYHPTESKYPLYVVHYWAKRFLSGEISEDELKQVAQNLIAIQKVITKMRHFEFDRSKEFIKATVPDLSEEKIDKDLRHDRRFGDEVKKLFQSAFNNPTVLANPELVIQRCQVVAQFLESSMAVYRKVHGFGTDYFIRYRVESLEFTKKFLLGEMTEEELNKFHLINKTVKEIKELIPQRHPQENDNFGRYCISIADKLSTESWMLEPDFALQLAARGIFPTQHLVSLLQTQAGQAWVEIEKLLDEIRRGRLDFLNPVQRDLEFINYIKASSKISIIPDYDSFASLRYNDSDSRLPALTANELVEARAAAYEAALFGWFVSDRSSQGRKVLVVGNERYGKLFVIDPLRPFLDKLRVDVTSCYVHSGSGSSEQELNFLKEQIKELSPDDIIIVDGTDNLMVGRSYRFPRSLATYKDWVTKLSQDQGREYTVSYYLPKQSKKIVIGDMQSELYVKPNNHTPQLIIANSVAVQSKFKGFPEEFKEHKPAYFDDPDQKSGTKKEIVFTPYGIKIWSERGVADFIKVIQHEISRALPEMFQLARPSTR